MNIPDWSFRFENAELRVVLGASKAGQLNPAGAEIVETESLQKPILCLVLYLLSRETARSTVEEQHLFDETPRGSAYRAICMVERCRLLYSSLGYPIPTLHANSRRRTVTKYIRWINQWYDLYEEGRAEDVSKFQSVYMFNLLWMVEAPKFVSMPDGWIKGCLSPFSSNHRRTIRYFSRCRRKGLLKECMRFSQCFIYFKKGCPPASSSFIRRSIDKHKLALTTKRPRLDRLDYLDVERGECTVIYRASLKNRIADIVQSVFRNYKHPVIYREPSKSASFHSTRSDGGQLSEINFDFSSCYGSKHVFCCFDHWDFHDTGYAVIKVPRKVRLALDWEFSPTEDILAKPVALTEPLKVRVITKESAWSTYALSGAQRALWKCLKNFPWFRLTGRPVTELDLPAGEGKWISVDYTAATDNLASDLSSLVIREICKKTGLPYKICRDSLVRHKIYYEGEPCVDQKNGQLMGSILSFIVLCVANATVISMAKNPQRFDPLDDILVNGDDGLFRGDQEVFNRWKAIADWCGLSPSPGKVYFSDEFCCINSQFFVKEDGLNKYVPFPNASGMMQFDARTYSRAKDPLSLGDSLRLWLSGFHIKEERDLAEILWYKTFDRVLRWEPCKDGKFVPNWVQKLSIDYFVPQTLGGLGLPVGYYGNRPISRESLARCRFSVKEGFMFRRKKTKLVKNPFQEDTQWTKLVCCVEPEACDVRLSKILGFKGVVEKARDKSVDQTDWFMRDLNPSLSTVSLSLLAGVHLTVAASSLDGEGELDFSQFRRLRRSRELQWCWDEFEEVFPVDLCRLRVEQGSRRLNVWEPRIHVNPTRIDEMTSHPYVNLLNQLQYQRLQPSFYTFIQRWRESVFWLEHRAWFRKVSTKQSN